MELAAKLPDGGTPQAVAVDVLAAKEASGLEADIDPLTLPAGAAENRFVFSTFFALRDVAQLTDNAVRSALDHSVITAYAAHPYISDEAVTLISTSQDFDEIASSLEDDGFERDGNTLTSDGDPEVDTYTAVAPGDGFIVLGYSAEGVEAVADGGGEPSGTGELELLEELPEAPARIATLRSGGPDCVVSVTSTDQANGDADLTVAFDSPPKTANLDGDLEDAWGSLGFSFKKPKVSGDEMTFDLLGSDETGLSNSPALLIGLIYSEPTKLRPAFYDCG